MRIYVTETTEFEKSKKSIERFIFGDDCIHSLEQGYLFAAGLILENRNLDIPHSIPVMKPYSEGYVDKILSIKYTITIK